MIFLDTSAFYAVEVEDDINHKRARNFLLGELRAGKYGSPLTSDYVIDETMTLLRVKHGIEAAIRFYDKIKRGVKIIWVDETIFEEALKLFRKDDKLRWSFTDCTSFAIMMLLDVRYAFSFDRNFEEAGFVRLP